MCATSVRDDTLKTDKLWSRARFFKQYLRRSLSLLRNEIERGDIRWYGSLPFGLTRIRTRKASYLGLSALEVLPVIVVVESLSA